VNYDDPPTPRAVVRGILGGATLVALVALAVVSVDEGHVEWKLVALVFALWGGYGLFDTVLGGVVEPLGRFVAGQLTGGDVPPGASITMEQETALLERLLAGDAAPPRHRAILAGIRLAEIYRTHQHDTAKADALIARLAAQYPDAPELRYVRPPVAG